MYYKIVTTVLNILIPCEYHHRIILHVSYASQEGVYFYYTLSASIDASGVKTPRTSGITSPNAHSIPAERMTRSVPISVRFTPPLSTNNMNRLGLDPSMILTLTIRRLRPWPLTLPESISSHTLFARADGCAWCHSDVVTARRQKSARTACIG
jgi:hypothetical protein